MCRSGACLGVESFCPQVFDLLFIPPTNYGLFFLVFSISCMWLIGWFTPACNSYDRKLLLLKSTRIGVHQVSSAAKKLLSLPIKWKWRMLVFFYRTCPYFYSSSTQTHQCWRHLCWIYHWHRVKKVLLRCCHLIRRQSYITGAGDGMCDFQQKK